MYERISSCVPLRNTNDTIVVPRPIEEQPVSMYRRSRSSISKFVMYSEPNVIVLTDNNGRRWPDSVHADCSTRMESRGIDIVDVGYVPVEVYYFAGYEGEEEW